MKKIIFTLGLIFIFPLAAHSSPIDGHAEAPIKKNEALTMCPKLNIALKLGTEAAVSGDKEVSLSNIINKQRTADQGNDASKDDITGQPFKYLIYEYDFNKDGLNDIAYFLVGPGNQQGTAGLQFYTLINDRNGEYKEGIYMIAHLNSIQVLDTMKNHFRQLSIDTGNGLLNIWSWQENRYAWDYACKKMIK